MNERVEETYSSEAVWKSRWPSSATLRASLSGTKDVVNQCLEFGAVQANEQYASVRQTANKFQLAKSNQRKSSRFFKGKLLLNDV